MVWWWWWWWGVYLFLLLFFCSSKATIYRRPPGNDILNKRMIYRYVRYAAIAGGRRKDGRVKFYLLLLFYIDDETKLEFQPQYAIFQSRRRTIFSIHINLQYSHIGNNNEFSQKKIDKFKFCTVNYYSISVC